MYVKIGICNTVTVTVHYRYTEVVAGLISAFDA